MLRGTLIIFALLALVWRGLSLPMARAQQLEFKQPEAKPGSLVRVDAQRGTEQSPLVVKVAPTAKTDTEREAEARERERVERSEKQKEKSDADLVEYTAELALSTQRLFFATCGLVIATLGLGLAAVFQSRDMRRSTAAAESAANAANLSARAAIGVELPIVRLDRLTLMDVTPGGERPATLGQMLPRRSRIMIQFKNSGRTAAEAITQCLEWRVVDKLPEIPVYDRFFPYAPGVFFPPDDQASGVGLQNYYINLADDQYNAIAERRAFLWLYGNVLFRDIITGNDHEFRFCAKWVTFPDAAGAPVGFVHDSGTPADYTKRT